MTDRHNRQTDTTDRHDRQTIDTQKAKAYQEVVILKGVVQSGDPLTVSIYQHIPLLSETRCLERRRQICLQNTQN